MIYDINNNNNNNNKNNNDNDSIYTRSKIGSKDQILIPIRVPN